MQNRKVTYELYPSPNQITKIRSQLRLHKQLWNGALEERIDAWQKAKLAISYEDQCKSLTRIRNDDELKDEWALINCSSQQVTLNRLNKAFNNFFNRIKKGEKSGFPRFKSEHRMTSLGFKKHGDGWSFKPKLKNNGKPDDFGNVTWDKHAVLYMQGVGHMNARGQARAAGIIKSCEVLCQNGKWFVSVTLECAETDLRRERKEHQFMAADWGMKDLLTIAQTSQRLTKIPSVTDDAVRFRTIDNPHWYKTSQAQSIALSQSVSRKEKFSKRWQKAQHARAVFEAKRARKRHDFQHQLSADIASRCRQFSTEALNIKSMTATSDNPYTKKKENAFHRELLDTAPGALFQKIHYKVLETGGTYLIAPTKVIKPSQTCPPCGHQQKKTLAQRIHVCTQCRFTAGRDEAASLVVLYWSMGILPPIKKEKRAGTERKPKSSEDDFVQSALKSRNRLQVQTVEFGGA